MAQCLHFWYLKLLVIYRSHRRLLFTQEVLLEEIVKPSNWLLDTSRSLGEKRGGICCSTLPKMSIFVPKNHPIERKIIFQPSIFRGYLSFPGENFQYHPKKDSSLPTIIFQVRFVLNFEGVPMDLFHVIFCGFDPMENQQECSLT